MFSNKWKNELCFLCLCNQKPEHLFHVEATLSPISKKTLLNVIENLVKSANQSIKLPSDTQLCIECSKKIINFDKQWCALLESIEKALNYLSVDLKAEDEELMEEEENGDDVVEQEPCTICDPYTPCAPPIKEVKKFEPPPTDYELVEKLKKENALNLFACLDKEKEIQQDVAIKEEEIINDPLIMVDELKDQILEENKELHSLLFPPPPEEDSLLENIEQHSEKEEHLQCHICFMEFANKTEIDEHFDQTHKKQLKFKCDKCEFAHDNENHLIIHKNSHNGLSEKQCPWCYKQYATKRCAMRHMEVHMEQKKYQCDKCGLGFVQHIQFQAHKMIHEGEENPMICEICKKRFKTRETFRYHARVHREDRTRYTCDQCGKVFVDKYTHTKHMRLHVKDNKINTNQESTTKIKPNFSCIICSEIFADKSQLDGHMEDSHDVVIQSSSK